MTSFGSTARDSNGNIYGNVTDCGFDNLGALYELNTRGTFSLLHSFNGSDGGRSIGRAIAD